MEELVRERMHEALAVEEPHPSLRRWVLDTVPFEKPERRWFQAPVVRWSGGAVALLLIAAVAVNVLYSGWTARQRVAPRLAGPAQTGPVGTANVVNPPNFTCSLPLTAANATTAFFVQAEMPSGVFANRTTISLGLAAAGSFDVAAGRWVPVPREHQSPDGRYYAYATPGPEFVDANHGSVHVIDVLTGQDRVVWAGPHYAQVLAFLDSGVYFAVGPFASPAPELWVVDPAHASSTRRIASLAYPSMHLPTLVTSAGAFIFTADSVDGWSDRLVRLDLATGQTTTWLTTSPIGPIPMEVLGADRDGFPILAFTVNPDTGRYDPNQPLVTRIMVVNGPNQSIRVSDGSDPSFQPTSALGDSHGIWFSEAGSIWFFEGKGVPRRVFDLPTDLFPNSSKFVPGFASPSPVPSRPNGGLADLAGPCT